MEVFIQHSGNANFRYSTGIDAECAFHVFSPDFRLNLLVVPDLEGDRARQESKVRDVLTFSDIGYHELRKKSKYPLGESLLELLRKKGVDRVKVSEDFPAKLALFLKEKIPLEVSRSPIAEMRAVKSEREVEMIRESCMASVKAFRFARSLLEKPGKERYCEEIRNLIELKLFSWGFLAENTIFASGIKTHQPHWVGYGKVEGHVVADIFPKSRNHGYYGDFTRTILIDCQEEIKNMLEACIEAKNRAIAKIKPGIMARDIHLEVCDVLKSYGYSTRGGEGFIHSTGHGVGLEVHEEPRIFENEDEIKKGMVFTVEPGLYYRNVGGVRVEDTVVVRKSHAEVLTPCEDLVELKR